MTPPRTAGHIFHPGHLSMENPGQLSAKINSVGAHDVERIVKTQIEELLLDRNRIARLIVAVDPQHVDAALTTAASLAETGWLLLGPATIGIERINLHENRIDIVIGEKGLLCACEIAAPEARTATITLSAPIERVRRGHELKLLIPGEAAPDVPAARDDRLVALLSEAMEARRIVLEVPQRSLQEIASANGRCRKRLAKLVRLSWLAPEIVQSILDGGQPASLTTSTLLDAELPMRWHDQRVTLGM